MNADFPKWQQTIPIADRADNRSCWILQDGKCLKIDGRVYSLLQQAILIEPNVGDLLDSFKVDIRDALLQYLLRLQQRGYISLLGEGQAPTHPREIEERGTMQSTVA